LYQLPQIEDKKLFLEAYAQTYLKEEVWDEHLVKKLNPFRRFLQVSAQANGTVVNYSQIAKDVQVDTKTIQSYFQILEDTLLAYFLEPYHASPRKRLRQNPKFYLFDIGVTRALTHDFALDIDYHSFGFGYRFEHFLITEMHRLNDSLKLGFQFSFIRTKDDREVDIVIEGAGEPLTLVEIKSTSLVNSSHLQGLAHFQTFFPKARLFCLSLDPNPKQFGNITALPWDKGLKELGLTG
jgi:predicted AAA+ superfamily ATPase